MWLYTIYSCKHIRDTNRLSRASLLLLRDERNSTGKYYLITNEPEYMRVYRPWRTIVILYKSKKLNIGPNIENNCGRFYSSNKNLNNRGCRRMTD